MLSLFIFALTTLLIMMSFLFFPTMSVFKKRIQSYWVIALLGAVFVLLTRQVDIDEVLASFFSPTPMNPIKLIILFLSMTVLSIYLDEIGFFAFVAAYILKRAGSSKWRIFFFLYFTVATLTLFTSNDIIVLTLTLFIIYFSKHARINPLPYLIAQFVAANTASMMFIIGNPTNMFLGSLLNLGFISYFQVMALPTLAVIITSLALLSLLFRKELNTPIEITSVILPYYNKVAVFVGLSHLGITIILLVISNYLRIEMWLITLTLAFSLTVFALVIKTKKEILATYKRMPFTFVPFLLSMFILVLSLYRTNLEEIMLTYLKSGPVIFTYGISSTIIGNLINNIPMSIFYGRLLMPLESSLIVQAGYASIIGSNLAALISPLGSLAGLMWIQLLKKENVSLSFGDFLWRGLIIGGSSLVVALLVLTLVI